MRSHQHSDHVIPIVTLLATRERKPDGSSFNAPRRISDAKWEEFAKVASWSRDDFVKKAGLATIPGATEPNSSVALSCAGVLTKLLEARAAKK